MTKTDQEPERCPVSVYDDLTRRSHICGRVVKRDGLCGLHAAAAERRERNAAERRERRERGERKMLEARGFLVAEGIPGHADYSTFSHEYTGLVVVSPADLIAWKARP